MQTVEDRIAKAQASGDLNEMRSALMDAKKAGADPAQTEAALAEIDRMQKAQGGGAPADAASEAKARADAHKKRGNEALKAGTKTAAREALECFTSGIEVRCQDNVLNGQLHGNRAHVRMLLRQFVEAVDDCRKAIEFDPKNLKNYFRAAKSSLQLDLHQNGIDFCEAGLAVEPKDAELMRLRDTCAEKLAAMNQRRAAAPTQGATDFHADEAMQIQDKVNGLSEQVDTLKMQIQGKERQRMKANLTRNNLNDVPPDTKMYRAIGRTFMQESRDDVDNSLSQTIASVEEEVPKLKKALTELESRKEGAEKELQEMIRAFKQQQAQQQAH